MNDWCLILWVPLRTTPYNEVRQGRYIMLGVCLFVCLSLCLSVRLLASLGKNYWRYLHKKLPQMYLWSRKKLIKFWNSSVSGIQRFWKDSLTLRDRAFFHNLACIFGESDRIFTKILLQMYKWTVKSPLNFGGNSIRSRDTDTDSGSRPLSPWRTYAVSETLTALVRTCWGVLLCVWLTVSFCWHFSTSIWLAEQSGMNKNAYQHLSK